MEMDVRDYECDLQGIVNNAVYQNYLEHARHEYLKHIGINFSEYTQKGINLVVTRVEMDYKSSLKSGDKFIAALRMERESRVRFAFYQDIYRLPGHKPVIKAKIIGTALNASGRPSIPDELEKAFHAREGLG